MRWAVLASLVVAASGCSTLSRLGTRDRDKDRDRSPADTASRPKPKPDKADPHWLDGPAGTGGGSNDLPAKKPGPPPADSWADPRDPNFDVRTESKGVLAGYVEDPERRKLANVFIEVQLTDPPAGGGAPVGVETRDDGDFFIKGLKPGESYTLTAKTTRDGRAMAGQVYAKPPNVYVRIPLVEGLTLPPAPKPGTGPRPGGSAALPGPAPAPLSQDQTSLPRPIPLDAPGSDGSWSPTGPGKPTPAPAPLPADNPTRVIPARPDLTTDGPKPEWRPPVTNIPPPGVPSVLPSPPTPPKGKTQSRSVRPKGEFVLVDTAGRTREFPSGTPGDLVLLDFMTTTCLPCKKAVPTLKALQSKYGTRGFEVVAVSCDEADTPTRRAGAAAYQRDFGLNYLVYTEPGPRPGAVMKKFQVEFYPTLVLIDGTGEIVWRGDSRDLGTLEDAIRGRLDR